VVPLVDLKRRHRRFQDAFLASADRVLGSGAVLLGPELDALERDLAPALHGTTSPDDHVVGVANGAAALQLVMAALGIGPGDEVIVPAFTAVPTASAVCATGATPVFADVDRATAAIDPVAVAAAVTGHTKAVVVVHLYGRPAEVEPLLSLGVPVIEDAAQAHGALTGVSGTAAIYSFYPTKNVGGIGDGGAVVTPDPELAAAIRRLRVHGMTEQYVHVDISQNFRMSELEAAWLALQLPHLGDDNRRRADIARHYHLGSPSSRWSTDHPDHVFHQCVLRHPDRDDARARLAARGVATGVHYPLALTQQPAYRHLATTACPEAEAWAAECISLPCFPELTDDEVEHVASTLAELDE
jgi:dTDP-4-amino-4,6-dideoxygalactose transaminase